MLLRFPDWPSRLSTYIDARRSEPFRWGANDCCTFALEGAVQAITGIDLLPGVRRPTSARSAVLFLKARGHQDSSGLADELLGLRLSSPRLAQRGDVVAFRSDRGVTLGVSVGSAVAAPGLHGLVFLPRLVVVMAWRI